MVKNIRAIKKNFLIFSERVFSFPQEKIFQEKFFLRIFWDCLVVQEAEFLDSFIQVFGRESSQNLTLLENYNY